MLGFRSYARTAFAVALVSLLAPLAAAQTTIQEGSWAKKGYAIAGSWSISEQDGRHFVVLDEQFSTKRAPDLKLFLSPLPLGEIGDDNATKGAVLVAELDSHKGAQRYEIPHGVDLRRLRSLIIHCEKYSKLWGGARLALGD